MVVIRTRRRRTRPGLNPGSGAIACFAGAATGAMPGTAGCRAGTSATLAAGTASASVSFCPFSFPAKLPTKLCSGRSKRVSSGIAEVQDGQATARHLSGIYWADKAGCEP